jgi:hypothetical protein
MSLNQKYTWGEFLKKHPEKKDLKRMSSEGRKAFETAFKAKMKEYLTGRVERVKVLQKKATEKKKILTEKVKTLQKAENWCKAKIYQKRVGRQDAWFNRLVKQADRIKILQKSL